MGIFTKTAKLSDPFVLQFSKKDNQALQQPDDLAPVLSNVVADRQAKQDVLKQLPLMTLAVACPFFKALRALAVNQGTSYEFETIDVLILAGEGRHQKYKPFINVENFSVDRLYRDFTGAFITTVFTNSDIAEVDYKQKQTWATMFIDAYQNANPQQKVVAMVPSEAASEQAPFKVQYVGLDVVDKPAKKDNENTGEQPAKKPEQSEKQAKAPTGKSPQPPKSIKPVRNPEKSHQPVATDIHGDKPKRRIKSDSDRLYDGQIKAPKFAVKQIQPVTEDDDQYVDYQCDQKKQHSNGYLLSLEKRVNAVAVQSLTQLREKQRQEIQSALVSFKKNNDPTKQLHNEIKQLISKEKRVEQKKLLTRLTASRDSDITQIKADADRAVKQREQEYKHQIKEQQAALDQTFIKKANELSATRLAERQAELKQQTQALQKDLEQQARAAYNEMVGSLVADHQNVVGSAYQKLAKSIDDYALEVTKVHLNAVEVQASADRAKFNLQDMERLESQVNQLKNKQADLNNDKQRLQAMVDHQTIALNEKQNQAVVQETDAQASKLDQLIALQLAAQTEKHKVVDTKPHKSNRLALALGTAFGTLVISSGGFWAWQTNQKMTATLAQSNRQVTKAQATTESINQKYYQLHSSQQALKEQTSRQAEDLSAQKESTSKAKDEAAKAQSQVKATTNNTSKTDKASQK